MAWAVPVICVALVELLTFHTVAPIIKQEQADRNSDELQPAQAIGSVFSGRIRGRFSSMITKYEQHHDGARINNHIDDGEKFRLQQNKQRRNRHKHHDQRKRAVKHMLLRQNVDGSPNRQCREKEKQYLNHDNATTRLVIRMFASASGSSTFQPNCISWS